MLKRGIPFIEINAKDNYEFGYKLGKALKERIHERLRKSKEFFRKKTANGKNFELLEKKAKRFIPALEKYFPHLLIEAQAMAKGAEVPFEKLFALMCENEIVEYIMYPSHCTTVALRTKDNNILLGHNEDWFSEYRENGLYIAKAKIGKNKFLAVSYIGNLAGSAGGLNSNKLAFTDTSLFYNRFTYDIPRSFHLRALLEAKTPEQARKMLNIEGSTGSNTLIVQSNSRIVDIEELWYCDKYFKSRNIFVHTNHPIQKKYQTKSNTKFESLIRYKRAYEIIKSEKEFTINTIKKILKDHKTNICGHLRKPAKIYSITRTIASYIMNPKEQWLMLCHGNPCKGKYVKYWL
jgi:hypothetical protein